jgi:hypothetical protein
MNATRTGAFPRCAGRQGHWIHGRSPAAMRMPTSGNTKPATRWTSISPPEIPGRDSQLVTLPLPGRLILVIVGWCAAVGAPAARVGQREIGSSGVREVIPKPFRSQAGMALNSACGMLNDHEEKKLLDVERRLRC